MRCFANNCISKHSDVGISFHLFPTNDNVRNKWIVNIGRKPTSQSRVCSLHFKDECFRRSKKGSYLYRSRIVQNL